MHATRKVRWTVISQITPQPWIACGGCGVPRAFRSSGKVRLNANGRRLDAWLVYRCATCDATWNRPIVERRGVAEIDAATLAALHASDPERVAAWAFDIEALKRRARRIDEFADVDIVRETLEPGEEGAPLEVELRVPRASSLRLDRLLAAELALPRFALRGMCADGRLKLEPGGDAMLRRRIRDGTRVWVAMPAGHTGGT